MTESALALSERYNKPVGKLILHTDDLIRRFGNTSLGDTCERVGADIPRKLAKSDRLTGASLSVLDSGGYPIYIAVGAAAALYRYSLSEGMDECKAEETFRTLTGVEGGTYYDAVMALFDMFIARKTLKEIISKADTMLKELVGVVI